MVSDEELEKGLRWVIRGLKETDVDPQNTQAVVIWMIENQMPDKEVWLAETEEKDELDRQAHITKLKEELATLEGETKGGIINV
jgi:hypothetical protein